MMSVPKRAGFMIFYVFLFKAFIQISNLKSAFKIKRLGIHNELMHILFAIITKNRNMIYFSLYLPVVYSSSNNHNNININNV